MIAKPFNLGDLYIMFPLCGLEGQRRLVLGLNLILCNKCFDSKAYETGIILADRHDVGSWTYNFWG